MQESVINQSKIKMSFEEISFQMIYDWIFAETFRPVSRMTICPYVANYAWSSPVSLIANLHLLYVVSCITQRHLLACYHYTAFVSRHKFTVPSHCNFLLCIHFLPHWWFTESALSTLAVCVGKVVRVSTISDMLKINSHRSFPQHPLLHFAAAVGWFISKSSRSRSLARLQAATAW